MLARPVAGGARTGPARVAPLQVHVETHRPWPHNGLDDLGVWAIGLVGQPHRAAELPTPVREVLRFRWASGSFPSASSLSAAMARRRVARCVHRALCGPRVKEPEGCRLVAEKLRASMAATLGASSGNTGFPRKPRAARASGLTCPLVPFKEQRILGGLVGKRLCGGNGDGRRGLCGWVWGGVGGLSV